MTRIGKKVPLAVLPMPSTSFTSDVQFEDSGGVGRLHFEFERGGALYSAGLQFDKVRAYRFRAEGHCTLWHVEGVYDTLVEVSHSEWVDELLAAEPPKSSGRWEIHHFMIYMDSSGCWEIGAASWSLIAEKCMS